MVAALSFLCYHSSIIVMQSISNRVILPNESRVGVFIFYDVCQLNIFVPSISTVRLFLFAVSNSLMKSKKKSLLCELQDSYRLPWFFVQIIKQDRTFNRPCLFSLYLGSKYQFMNAFGSCLMRNIIKILFVGNLI